MGLSKTSTLAGFAVHYVWADGSALLSRENQVWRYDARSQRKERLFDVTFRRSLLNWPMGSSLRRLLRGEIYHVLPIGKDEFLVVFDYQVLRVTSSAQEQVLSLPVRRPLRIGWVPERNWIFFGDYATTPPAEGSCLYISRDGGRSWQRGYCFPPEIVRHIHGVVYDNYRDCFWILTGDYQQGAGIWQSRDLQQVDPVLVGEQRYRAVELVPLPEGLLWATDSELEENAVLFYDLSSKELYKRISLPGSSFYCRHAGDYLLVSTVVEPSKVNRSRTATLWGSKDGNQWQQLLALPRSRLPLRYFGYAEIVVPIYEDTSVPAFYYFSTRNCKGGDRTIIIPARKWGALMQKKGTK